MAAGASCVPRWRSGGRTNAVHRSTPGGSRNGHDSPLPRFRLRFYLDGIAGRHPRGLCMEVGPMSAGFAIALAILTLGSCLASYHCGQRNMFIRMRRFEERRKRWAEWEDFED